MFDVDETATGGGTLSAWSRGYQIWSVRAPVPPPSANGIELGSVSDPLNASIELEPSVSPFPPSPNPFLGSIAPPDPNDPGGDVYFVLPPEAIPNWQPQVVSVRRMRGDFGGVTTPLAPPFVPGASTTPPNMWYSPLLPWYVGKTMPDGSDCVDYYLNAVQARGYTHVHLDRWEWDAAGCSPAQVVALVQRIQARGLIVTYWATSTSDDRSGGWPTLEPLVAPILQALIAGGCGARLAVLVGGELNNGTVPGNGPNGLDGLINGICAITNPVSIPTYLHFTSNYASWPPPGMGQSAWWAQFAGGVPGYGTLAGLCWQGDQNQPAGTMGGEMWSARQIVSAGWPGFDFIAFELLVEAQFNGQCDETNGRRRGYEMLCCPSVDGRSPALAGFMNGGSEPDGTIL